MAFLGMVPEEVQNLGHLLANQVPQELDTIINKVTSQLHGVHWTGTDRTKFESDWNSTYVVQLQHIKQALTQFGQHALQEAQQQLDASAT